MTTAVFTPTAAGNASTPSKFFLIAKRVMDALIESRAKSAARKMRQHEAFMQDLSRRQDHSPLFLIQDNPSPFKI